MSGILVRVQWVAIGYAARENLRRLKENEMRFLHAMVRIGNIDASLHFFCHLLGLKEARRVDNPAGRFTLIFLTAPDDEARATLEKAPLIELTFNWDPETYSGARNFGHLAYETDDIYAVCQRLMDGGIVINRPPRDGAMAFVRSPDGISIELLQKGSALARQEPWASMGNTGSW